MNRVPAGCPRSGAKSTDKSPRLIALDWGTSSLRTYLLGRHGELIQEHAKPWGIMRVPDGDFALAFHALVDDWLQSCPGLPIIAAGMIGSSQDWHEVAYQHCPAGLGRLASGLETVHVGGGVRMYIVPGVIEAGPLPNVMRGEETQVVGSLAREPSLQTRARLIVPGTHSKWVEVR
jgi:2-dehydro-3-deoxygalactonokinase